MAKVVTNAKSDSTSDTPVKNENESQLGIFNKLTGYPILFDSFSKALTLYNSAKSKTPQAVNSVLNQVEETVSREITKLSSNENVLSKIKSVDNFAVDKLDQLEKACPMLLKPTDELLAEGQKVYDEQVKQRLNELFTRTQQGIGQASQAVHHPVDTANQSMHFIIDQADSYLDCWLSEQHKTNPNDHSQSQKSELQTPNLKEKSTRLTKKMQIRLRNRALREYKLLHRYVNLSIGVLKTLLENLKDTKENGLDVMVHLKTEFNEEMEARNEELASRLNAPYLRYQENNCSSKNGEFASSPEKDFFDTAAEYARSVYFAAASITAITYRHLPDNYRDRVDNLLLKADQVRFELNKYRFNVSDINSKSLMITLENVKKLTEQTLNSLKHYAFNEKLNDQSAEFTKELELIEMNNKIDENDDHEIEYETEESDVEDDEDGKESIKHEN